MADTEAVQSNYWNSRVDSSRRNRSYDPYASLQGMPGVLSSDPTSAMNMYAMNSMGGYAGLSAMDSMYNQALNNAAMRRNSSVSSDREDSSYNPSGREDSSYNSSDREDTHSSYTSRLRSRRFNEELDLPTGLQIGSSQNSSTSTLDEGLSEVDSKIEEATKKTNKTLEEIKKKHDDEKGATLTLGEYASNGFGGAKDSILDLGSTVDDKGDRNFDGDKAAKSAAVAVGTLGTIAAVSWVCPPVGAAVTVALGVGALGYSLWQFGKGVIGAATAKTREEAIKSTREAGAGAAGVALTAVGGVGVKVAGKAAALASEVNTAKNITKATTLTEGAANVVKDVKVTTDAAKATTDAVKATNAVVSTEPGATNVVKMAKDVAKSRQGFWATFKGWLKGSKETEEAAAPSATAPEAETVALKETAVAPETTPIKAAPNAEAIKEAEAVAAKSAKAADVATAKSAKAAETAVTKAAETEKAQAALEEATANLAKARENVTSLNEINLDLTKATSKLETLRTTKKMFPKAVKTIDEEISTATSEVERLTKIREAALKAAKETEKALENEIKNRDAFKMSLGRTVENSEANRAALAGYDTSIKALQRAVKAAKKGNASPDAIAEVKAAENAIGKAAKSTKAADETAAKLAKAAEEATAKATADAEKAAAIKAPAPEAEAVTYHSTEGEITIGKPLPEGISRMVKLINDPKNPRPSTYSDGEVSISYDKNYIVTAYEKIPTPAPKAPAAGTAPETTERFGGVLRRTAAGASNKAQGAYEGIKTMNAELLDTKAAKVVAATTATAVTDLKLSDVSTEQNIASEKAYKKEIEEAQKPLETAKQEANKAKIDAVANSAIKDWGLDKTEVKALIKEIKGDKLTDEDLIKDPEKTKAVIKAIQDKIKEKHDALVAEAKTWFVDEKHIPKNATKAQIEALRDKNRNPLLSEARSYDINLDDFATPDLLKAEVKKQREIKKQKDKQELAELTERVNGHTRRHTHRSQREENND